MSNVRRRGLPLALTAFAITLVIGLVLQAFVIRGINRGSMVAAAFGVAAFALYRSRKHG